LILDILNHQFSVRYEQVPEKIFQKDNLNHPYFVPEFSQVFFLKISYFSTPEFFPSYNFLNFFNY